MTVDRLLVSSALFVLGACNTAPPPPSSGPIAPSDPVSQAFAGCQGACGQHVAGPDPEIVVQPGAAIGQRTYCPVSGAVFRVDATHQHVDHAGQPLYFCCQMCAQYFEQHRAEVLRARGIEPG